LGKLLIDNFAWNFDLQYLFTLNRKIYLPLTLGGFALVALFIGYLFGLNVPPAPKMSEVATHEHDHDEVTNAPMMNIPQLDFEDYLAKTKKKLHPQILEDINKLEAELQSAQNIHDTAHVYEKLAQKWYDIKKYEFAAYYFAEFGILENSEKYLTFASQIVNEHIGTIPEQEVKFWMGAQGARALEKLVEQKPKDKDLKMDLALMYIDNAGQPMKGVAELQAIVAEDSSNFRANMILGEMAIQSRQFDKAVDRCQLILRYHPKSWEARVILAYAYHNLNQNEDAKRLLNEAKELNNNPEFHADVDKYLQSIQ